MPVHSTAVHATLAALGTFATLAGRQLLAGRADRPSARGSRGQSCSRGQSPQLGRPLRNRGVRLCSKVADLSDRAALDL